MDVLNLFKSSSGVIPAIYFSLRVVVRPHPRTAAISSPADGGKRGIP